MYRAIIILSILHSIAFCLNSQTPNIDWENTIGGGSTDILYTVKQSHDNGFLLGGFSSSTIYADKSENNIGSGDFWVLKLDTGGNVTWQNTIGGNSEDYLISIYETKDKGIILGGYSNSGIFADKDEENVGGYDYWIVKVDSVGDIQWQNTIGGNGDDVLQTIIQTNDNGYIVGGYSNSNIYGDKSEPNLGNFDYWIVKLDSLGAIEWQNTIGGNSYDYLYKIEQTFDNGYILGGASSSGISGDKSEVSISSGAGLPTLDYWIVRLDSTGNILWQNTIGGNSADYLYDIKENIDGGFIIAGASSSGISADKTLPSFGSLDFWVLKISSTGNIIWQSVYGGDLEEGLEMVSLELTNYGYTIAGSSSSSISGNKTEANIGINDYWVISIDTLGAILWQKDIGGNLNDKLFSMVATNDGGYFLGGQSNSNTSGDKNEDNIGNGDYWVVRLTGNCMTNTYYEDFDGDGFGNELVYINNCTAPTGYVNNNLDCNDTNNMINPSIAEICNFIDDNCNAIADDGLALQNFYEDSDADLFGNPDVILLSCLTEVSGYTLENTDCNDTDSNINPLMIELCNNIDDNCNEIIDEGLPLNEFFLDYDGDNFGNSLSDTLSCLETISGYVTDNTDCNDFDININPDSPEILNGIDDNCNEIIDEGFNSVDDINNLNMVISPNPNNGNFGLYLGGKTSGQILISIFNLHGQAIYKQTFYSDQNLFINLANNYLGPAIMIIEVDNKFIIQTLIITK